MSNRDYGEGSISQRKDGTWTGRIYLGRDSNGKQKVKAVYGKTEKEVKNRIKEIKTQLIKYDNITLSKVTLSELLTDWLQNIKKYELKASSYDRVEYTINHNISPYIGYLQISSIKPNDIQRYINNLTDIGYSYSTIKKAYNAINASLRFAVERDYIIKNPCASVHLPKQKQRPKYDIEFFTDTEVYSITESATSRFKTGNYRYKHGYAIILLLNTGMRVGELLALKWKNVDFVNKQIFITETRSQVIDRTNNNQKYVMVDRSTKTQSSCRYIPINSKSLEALMYFKSLGYSNPYVMANSDTGLITYRNLFRVLENILDSNGINHGSLHTLRHTFATRLFKKGVDIKVISELLGHSDISITIPVPNSNTKTYAVHTDKNNHYNNE